MNRNQPCSHCNDGKKLDELPPGTKCTKCGRFIVQKPQKKRFSWREIQTLYVGKKFRRKRFGTTRTIRCVDVTLGGDPCVRVFRWQRQPSVMPQTDWLDWVKGAIEIK